MGKPVGLRGVGEEADLVCTKEKANATSLSSVLYPQRVLMTSPGTCEQRIGEGLSLGDAKGEIQKNKK